MSPGSFTNFFLASAGAGAALVGLLFVAVSVAPEQPFAPGSAPERRGVATAAFIALANAFFVSLGALIPTAGLGWFALAVGGSSIVSTLQLGATLFRRSHVDVFSRVRSLTLVAVSLIVFGWQFYVGDLLIHNEADIGAITILAYLMLASHGIGLGRAWELLGAPRRGLLAWMSPLYELNRTTPADHTDGKAAAPQKPPEKAT
jgi:hypothetical protein